jgi:hypothetical protein
MATPQMKTAIEELQTEQLRNAAEAKAIYWCPGRDQRRKTMDAKANTRGFARAASRWPLICGPAAVATQEPRRGSVLLLLSCCLATTARKLTTWGCGLSSPAAA